MKKMINLKSIASLILMCGLMQACSDDKDTPVVKDENGVSAEQIADVFKRDVVAGSISRQDFDSKVKGKVWVRAGSDFAKYVDNQGNEYDYTKYAPAGGMLNEKTVAYSFDGDTYTKFYNPSYLNYDGNMYHRINVAYSYDAETGMVRSDDADMWELTDDDKNVLFYIESVTDEEMIIHEDYKKVALIPTEPNPEYCNMYLRVVLQSVTGEKAQSSWWNKYVEDK